VADSLHGVALVTGGGRGIGASIARELAEAGMQVWVTGRTQEQVEAVASEIGGSALTGDVSRRADVERWAAAIGDVDLLVNNAGIAGTRKLAWEEDADDWWRVFEVNTLGPFLTVRAFVPRMIERGAGRIVSVSSGASYLPPPPGVTFGSSYGASKAALGRFSETLEAELAGTGVHAFFISPGLVRSDMNASVLSDDAPWTPPELAPRLVRVLASGRADALGGRYIHAEHDDVEELIRRANEIREHDLNAIRLRR
jgi:3-oxoacyl-[acyl-carrier protein] reductase